MSRRTGPGVRAAVAGLAAGGMLGALLVPLAPPPAAGQERCLPAGGAVAPVPWSQRLLAPQRVWPFSTGAGQRVAVVSTGVADHPQLAGAVAAETDLAPPPEFGEPSGEADCLGVGTGVAGIIAAGPADGVGFHGTAPDARLLSAKVVGDQFPTDAEPPGQVRPGVLADAVDWAVDREATVVALPSVTYQDSDALAEAVARALAADIVVVAAVGDRGDGDEPPGVVPYPAAYDGVIGVGAVDADGRAGASRPGHVDLVAPGVDVVTSYPGGGLGAASGTGLAAGYVAGAVALVRAYRPELSQAEVAHRLFATAAPAPEGAGSAWYGYGIVDPYQAVLARVVEGSPAALPAYQPAEPDPDRVAREAAERERASVATALAAVGAALLLTLAGALGFGRAGRRRRWRVGFRRPVAEQPRSTGPEPPVELFGDR